jgi:hypothetical protein
MRVLVYKRTHPGDPSEDGCFGVSDCMGAIRGWTFDAVIGVGGIGREPRSHNIAGKINWIGIGAHTGRWYRRGPRLTFGRFHDFGTHGDSFRKRAPQLAGRMYAQRIRHLMTDSMSEVERKEVQSILTLANDAPPSPALPSGFRRRRFVSSCRPRRESGC